MFWLLSSLSVNQSTSPIIHHNGSEVVVVDGEELNEVALLMSDQCAAATGNWLPEAAV